MTERRRGGRPYSLSQDAKKYILDKNATNVFTFLPRTLIGEFTVVIQGSGVHPPSRGVDCPIQDKFLATLMR